MSDEVFYIRPRFFRRKRKFEGKGIDAELATRLDQAQRFDKGVLCRACGKWRAWKDIYFKYATDERAIVRSWFCNVCDNMVKEDYL